MFTCPTVRVPGCQRHILVISVSYAQNIQCVFEELNAFGLAFQQGVQTCFEHHVICHASGHALGCHAKNWWLEHETEQSSEGLDASQLAFIMKFLGSFLQE